MMVEADTELLSLDPDQIELIKTLITSDTEPSMIAMSFAVSEPVVHLIIKQMEEQFKWTPERNKELMEFLYMGLETDAIATSMKMPIKLIQDKIENIKNSNKKPIKNSRLYENATPESHKKFIPPICTASIGIDETDNPTKMSKENSNEYVLYSGGCSCENQNKHISNFVILGPSGAGKTTFVDSLANFLFGVEMFDKFRYKIVDERQL